MLSDLVRADRAPGSDFRLTDRYVAPADLLERMNCVPGEGPIHHAVQHLIGCALIAAKAGQFVSYSRGHSWYAARRRVGYPFTYGATTAAVDLLVAYGWIDEQRAQQDDHLVTQMQSSFRATQKLLDLAAGSKVVYEETERDSLILRDESGNPLPVPNVREADRMRRDMDRRNTFFKNVKINLVSERITQTDGAIIVDDRNVIPTAPYLQLTQICSRGSLYLHRRLYAWIQNLPSSLRSELTINDEAVVELDYRSMHPRMLYALRGIDLDPDFDPYDLEGYPRCVGKLAMLVGVSSRSLGQAIGHLISMKDLRDEHGNIVRDENGDPIRVRKVEFRDGTRWEYSKAETRKILMLLKKRNPAISDLFCSDAGIHLMSQDSRIACEIVDALIDRGIPCVPVHDSFIVPRSHETDLKAEMDAAWKRFLGRIPSLRSSWFRGKVYSTESNRYGRKILHDGSPLLSPPLPGVVSETRVSEEIPGVTQRNLGVTNASPSAREAAVVAESVSVVPQSFETANPIPARPLPVLPRLRKPDVATPAPVAWGTKPSVIPVKLPSMKPGRAWEARGQAKRNSVARSSRNSEKPIQRPRSSVLDSLRSQGVDTGIGKKPVARRRRMTKAESMAASAARKAAEVAAERAAEAERKAAFRAAVKKFEEEQKTAPARKAYAEAMKMTRIARGEVVIEIDPDDWFDSLTEEEIARMNRPRTPKEIEESEKATDEIPF